MEVSWNSGGAVNVPDLKAAGVYSGVVAQAQAGEGIRRLLKVKSHLDPEEEGIAPLEAWLRKGNEEADVTAKASQAFHPPIAPADLASAGLLVRIARAFCALAGALMPQWPRLDLATAKWVSPSTPPPPPPPPAQDAEGHLAEWRAGGSFQCCQCFRVCRTLRALEEGRCPGQPDQRLTGDALRALGHSCVGLECSDGTALLVCRKCGCMSSGGYVRSLARRCEPTRKARDRSWNALDRGLHPKKPAVTVAVGPWGRG